MKTEAGWRGIRIHAETKGQCGNCEENPSRGLFVAAISAREAALACFATTQRLNGRHGGRSFENQNERQARTLATGDRRGARTASGDNAATICAPSPAREPRATQGLNAGDDQRTAVEAL